jgi:hypothetical protein
MSNVVKLNIKYVKPFKEVSPEVDGKKLSTIFGVRLYNATESKVVQKSFKAILANEELERANAKLARHEAEGDKAEEEFYTIRKDMQNAIEDLVAAQEVAVHNFYKSQVLFIRNASAEDTSGKDITIADTRTAAPIESLWANEEECLVVLLDSYFNVPSIRDSLISKLLEVIFNFTEDKAKNSK